MTANPSPSFRCGGCGELLEVIYPEWSGFDVVLIHGRYVIVRPQTREIVYIIEG